MIPAAEFVSNFGNNLPGRCSVGGGVAMEISEGELNSKACTGTSQASLLFLHIFAFIYSFFFASETTCCNPLGPDYRIITKWMTNMTFPPKSWPDKAWFVYLFLFFFLIVLWKYIREMACSRGDRMTETAATRQVELAFLESANQSAFLGFWVFPGVLFQLHFVFHSFHTSPKTLVECTE